MLTQAELKTRLHYDQETGIFTWIKYIQSKNRNGTKAGGMRADGYQAIYLRYKQYMAHRLAWLYMTGNWPNGDLDHIDGNRQNNRISNLRECTQSLNNQNQRKAKSFNTTGYLGVSYRKENNRYRARIGLNKKVIHIGDYLTAEEAHAAYIDAKRAMHEFGTI